MSLDNHDDPQQAGANPPQQPYYQPTYVPAKSHTGWKVFWGVFTTLSVLANLFFVLLIIGLSVAAFVGSGQEVFAQDVIRKGDKATKIAVINVFGVIDDKASAEIYEQIKVIRDDMTVRGVILRVNSPGGTVSASDQIYHQISSFRQETGRPAVAFMEGIAASGGYYSSVACDRIVAEPTVITGSIGVIMTHMVIEQLLQEKLGIVPVVIKSGPRKDWPSLFKTPSPEELAYLNDKVIVPAYDRFVQIVADGRVELSVADVKELADGSIYTSQEAVDNKLIDEIGYLDKAINVVSKLAGVTNPHVVEYKRPFSLSALLSAESKSGMEISRSTLREFAGPQILYIWQGY